MYPEDFVGGSVCQHLDHAGGVAQGAGTAVGHERKGAGFVSATGRFELLFGLTDPGDLRVGVNNPGNGVEVDMPMLAGDALSHGHALFFGLVRQHGAAHHVTHRPDLGQVGLAIGVHHDGAALVELQAHGVSRQAGGVGHAADRDDQLVNVQRYGFALGVGVGD